MGGYHGSGGYYGHWGPSCVCTGQALRTPNGYEGVENVLRRWAAGHRVELDVDGAPGIVVFAMETWARSYELRLADGRSVRLTGGHAVPSGEDTAFEGPHGERARVLGMRWVHLTRPPVAPHLQVRGTTLYWASDGLRFADGHLASFKGSRLIDDHAWILGDPEAEAEYALRFAPIATGDEVDGSAVVEVVPLGSVPAVRIATDRMGWLSVRSPAGDVRVGQRQHEYADLFYEQDAEFIFTPFTWRPRAQLWAVEGQEATHMSFIYRREDQSYQDGGSQLFRLCRRLEAARYVECRPIREWGERPARIVRRSHDVHLAVASGATGVAVRAA